MRPTILVFVSRYLPGFKSGGPVRTIANMIERLGAEFNFRIVTQDRDVGDRAPYPNIQVDTWNTVGKAKVFYCSPRSCSFSQLRNLIVETPHDILYLNSFFSQVFSVRPLILRKLGLLPHRPVLLAPRGEFSPGALRLKGGRKRIYVYVSRRLGLYEGVFWQASSAYEAEDLEKALGSVSRRCVVAPDLPTLLPHENFSVSNLSLRGRPLRIIFLSRISPMKNLAFVLRVLRQVRVPVDLNIYGPIDDDRYWDYCRGLIKLLPEHVSAKYFGSIAHEEVPRAMAENDLFFLPTLGENYGHVIPEALSSGTPVLISSTTPWRGLAQESVGWDLPLDSEDEFRIRIEKFAAMTDQEYQQMRERAHAYGRKCLEDHGVIEANRQMFLRVLSQG